MHNIPKILSYCTVVVLEVWVLNGTKVLLPYELTVNGILELFLLLELVCKLAWWCHFSILFVRDLPCNDFFTYSVQLAWSLNFKYMDTCYNLCCKNVYISPFFICILYLQCASHVMSLNRQMLQDDSFGLCSVIFVYIVQYF